MGNMGAWVAKTRNNAPTKRFCIGKANHWREPVITDVSFNVTSYYRCESSKNLTHTQKHQLIVTIVSIFTFFLHICTFPIFAPPTLGRLHLLLNQQCWCPMYWLLLSSQNKHLYFSTTCRLLSSLKTKQRGLFKFLCIAKENNNAWLCIHLYCATFWKWVTQWIWNYTINKT